MAYWEFLIQREDDRSWLPLEAKEVEILEGRYRLAARSSHANAPVKIHIVYQPAHASSPKPLAQRRSGITNQTGLILIFPFSQLKPGTLSLTCTVEVVGQVGSKYEVKLQILEKGIEAMEVWETDWQEETIILPPKPKSTKGSNTTAQLTTPEAIVPTVFSPGKSLTLPLNAELALVQEAFVISGAQSFQLVGTATLGFDQGYVRDPQRQPWQGKLKIVLQEPQTLRTIASVWYTLTVEVDRDSLQIPFNCQVTVPTEAKTHLLLGEVTLYPAQTALETNASPLASYSFTVTSEVGELLETLANLRETLPAELDNNVDRNGRQVDAGATEAEGNSGTDKGAAHPSPLLRLIDLTEKEPTPHLTPRSSTNNSLPPKLYQPSPDEVAAMKVQLPTFPKPLSDQAVSQNSQASQEIDDNLQLNDLWLEQEDLLAQGENAEEISLASGVDELVQVEPEDGSRLESSISAESVFLVEEHQQTGGDRLDESLIELEPASDPTVEEGVKAEESGEVNFQEQFWAKLSNLADDEELSDWLAQDATEEWGGAHAMAASSSSTVDLMPLPEQSFSNGHGSSSRHSTVNFSGFELSGEEFEDTWLAHEVVVDEDFGLPAHVPTSTRLPLVSLLSEDEPIPIPDLDLEDGELISGSPLPICVTIPNLPSRIYVKLWISDRQMRTLLEGPRWLTDFRPDGFGNLESTIQLTVPFGSLEIQIAAVAVETHSQRESHKVTVDRSIVPPDLPMFSVDDLDL